MSVRPFSIRFIDLTCLPVLRRLPVTAALNGFSKSVAKTSSPRTIAPSTRWSQNTAPRTDVRERSERWIVVDSVCRLQVTPVAHRPRSQNRSSKFFVSCCVFLTMWSFHNVLLFICKLSTGCRGERKTNTAAYRTACVQEKTRIYI